MKNRLPIPRPTSPSIQRVAEDLYIYGYPLLLMDVFKRTHTATPFPTSHSAPLNQFAHERSVAQPHDKHAVHATADCLRSSAWLDLSKECVVLSIPRSNKYYLLSFFSAWYEIFETSSPRNTGVHGSSLGFVGPRWHGKLPAGVKRIVAPTETVWIEGWLEADGPDDSEFVHRVQDQLRLTPRSDWGTPSISHGLPFRVDIDHKITPQDQVATLDTRTFYSRLSRLMLKNPAPACDAEMVAEFARIGFFPSADFAFEMLPPDTTQAMHQAVVNAQLRIDDAAKSDGARRTINNWSIHAHPGRYQRNYLDRAAAARMGLASALAEDVLCFHTAVDQNGEPLNGANRYVINFSRDLFPPVDAFWSITLYDPRQHLASNDIHRNAIGDRNRLRLDADNSLSVCVQHDWPGTTRDSNWLPAPKDAFNLALRMYAPKPDVLIGNWSPPAVIRTK